METMKPQLLILAPLLACGQVKGLCKADCIVLLCNSTSKYECKVRKNKAVTVLSITKLCLSLLWKRGLQYT